MVTNRETDLICKELPLHEFLDAVRIVRAVWVYVQLHGVEVSAEHQQALGQLDALLLEDGRLQLAQRVYGGQGEGHHQRVTSWKGRGGRGGLHV